MEILVAYLITMLAFSILVLVVAGACCTIPYIVASRAMKERGGLVDQPGNPDSTPNLDAGHPPFEERIYEEPRKLALTSCG